MNQALSEELRTDGGLVSSEPIAVESARTIDRLSAQGALTMEEATERIGAVNEWLEAIDLVLLRPPVLSRASDPMPMPVGTLDAILLATALIWRDRMGPLPEMATHDAALGAAARAFGFDLRRTRGGLQLTLVRRGRSSGGDRPSQPAGTAGHARELPRPRPPRL